MNEKNNATLYAACKFWSSLTGINQKVKLIIESMIDFLSKFHLFII
jgi:hypothetical protein